MRNLRDSAGDLKFYLFIFMCASVRTCEFTYIAGMRIQWRLEQSLSSSGTRITGSYELPYEFWNMNLGRLHE